MEAVRDAGDDAQADAREALNALLAGQFDEAQKSRETDLAALEAKVARLRELHDKRAAAKTEIVARRADTLLRAADGLGWEGAAGEDKDDFFGKVRDSGGGFGGPVLLPPRFGTGGSGFGGLGDSAPGFGLGGFGGPTRVVPDLNTPVRAVTFGMAGTPPQVYIHRGSDDGLRRDDELTLTGFGGKTVGRIRLKVVEETHAHGPLVDGDPGDLTDNFGKSDHLTARTVTGRPPDAVPTGVKRAVRAVSGTVRGPVEITFQTERGDRVRFGDELRVVRDYSDGTTVGLGRIKITDVTEDAADGAFFGATGTFIPENPADPVALSADDDHVVVPPRPEQNDG